MGMSVYEKTFYGVVIEKENDNFEYGELNEKIQNKEIEIDCIYNHDYGTFFVAFKNMVKTTHDSRPNEFMNFVKSFPDETLFDVDKQIEKALDDIGYKYKLKPAWQSISGYF